MFDVAALLRLRMDFTAGDLRRHARQTRDANQARRLLALAAIYEGGSRGDAARMGGVGLQIVRDWVVKFNAQGPDGLIDKKAPGQALRLNDTHRAALARAVDEGPIPAIHGVVRWRLVDLCQWVFEEFRVSVSVQTLSRQRSAIEGSPPVRAIMPRPRARSRILKKLPRLLGRDRAGEEHRT